MAPSRASRQHFACGWHSQCWEEQSHQQIEIRSPEGICSTLKGWIWNDIWIRWEADLHQLVPNQGGRNQPLRKFGYILTLVQTNITWPRWVTSLWCICLTLLAYRCHTSPTCMWEWRYQIHCESSVNADPSIFQLAICATLKDELVGVKFISDYLLWWGFWFEIVYIHASYQ